MTTLPDKQSLRTFLADTVTLLCKNFLRFESEFSIEGLVGITLDQKDVFLISIHETVKSPEAAKLLPSKYEESAISVTKSAAESNLTQVCNLTSLRDAVPLSAVGHDVTNVKVTHDDDVARQPAVLLPDDTDKGDELTNDLKLEVGEAISIIRDQSYKPNEHDLSSSVGPVQDSAALPLASDSHVGGGTVAYDCSRTLEKLDYSARSVSYSARSVSGGEGNDSLVHQSSNAELARSTDCHKVGLLPQSRDFEVIEIKEESLSEDELMFSNPPSSSLDQNMQQLLQPSQLCSQDFRIQGTSSLAMDPALGMGYSYWEGNPINVVQALNQSAICVTSSAPNPGSMLVKRGPKSKKRKFYECLKCGSKLTTAYGLKKHDTIIHQGNYKYTCHLCGKGLRTEYNLRGHMASRHNMRKDYQCTMCSREFGYRHTLRDHMVTCHGVTVSVDPENSGITM